MTAIRDRIFAAGGYSIYESFALLIQLFGHKKMKNLIKTLIALCVLSQLTLVAEEIASSAPSIYVSGHIKKPQRILAFTGATLGGVLAQSGGVDPQGHLIFVYRETLDGVYLYSFEVRMLKSMGVSMFTIQLE